MSDTEFETFVEKAIDNLPDEFSKKLENVSLVINDWPSDNQQRILAQRGQGGLLLGLYEGIPQTRRGSYGIGGSLPDKITLFKVPLQMISKTPGSIEQNIRDTVIHEIAHHFGLSDEGIGKAMSNKRRD